MTSYRHEKETHHHQHRCERVGLWNRHIIEMVEIAPEQQECDESRLDLASLRRQPPRKPSRETDTDESERQSENPRAQQSPRIPNASGRSVKARHKRPLRVEEILVQHLPLRDQIRRVEIPAFVLIETAQPHRRRAQHGKREDGQRPKYLHFPTSRHGLTSSVIASSTWLRR